MQRRENTVSIYITKKRVYLLNTVDKSLLINYQITNLKDGKASGGGGPRFPDFALEDGMRGGGVQLER